MNTEDTEWTEDAEEKEKVDSAANRVSEEKDGYSVSLRSEELTGHIRQIAYEVHEYFGRGFLEKVYENALANRLRKSGVRVLQQVELSVKDADGTQVGQYVADLLVEDQILVEVKAIAELAGHHRAQTVNYLKATGLGIGLLLNFGNRRFQMRRVIS